MVKTLVFGASGMLGSAVCAAIGHDGLIVPDRRSYDFLDRASAATVVRREKPEVVINCAAMTNVDGCERELHQCLRVNALAVEHMAVACAEAGARLVHISSDFVFDGLRPIGQAYSDLDLPDATTGAYAVSKRMAESAALAAPDALVIRTSWLFGGMRKTFPEWFFEQANILSSRGEPVPIVMDRYGSPTCVVDLSEVVVSLAASSRRGIVHAVNAQDGPVSQAEYGIQSYNALGGGPANFAQKAQAELVSARIWSVKRPVNTTLNSTIPMRHWLEALKEVML